MGLRAELVILLWMGSFIYMTLNRLGASSQDKSSARDLTIAEKLGDMLFLLMSLSLGVSITTGVAWAGSWWLYSTETFTKLDQCASESNPVGVPPRDEAEVGPPAGVLTASLEHVVPSCKLSITAGGLGKVLKMQLAHARRTPERHFVFAFPMVGGQDYSAFDEELPPLQGGAVRVRAKREPCGNLVFLALEHERFTRRTKETIYPDARSRYDFLCFFGLWNRAVAELLIRLHAAGEIGVYHCTDYHGGLAPHYVRQWGGPIIPTCLTLHNALYQGGMLTVLSEGEWSAIERVLQLERVRNVADTEGDFNMLRAVMCHIREHQNGEGITAVSNQYAANLTHTLTLLRGMPVIGHPNPTLDTDRLMLPAGVSLAAHKAACKARMQQALGLSVDPEATVIGFVGRLTFEKGVDLVMEAAFWLLGAYPKVQIFLVGPIGDEVGHHVATRLDLTGQEEP